MDLTPECVLELLALLQLLPTNWRGARMPDVASFDDMLAQLREKWVCGPDASTTDCLFVLGDAPDPATVALIGNGPLRVEIATFLVRAYHAMPALLAAAEENAKLRGTVDDIASYVQPSDVEDSAVQELPPLADAVRDLVADRDALLALLVSGQPMHTHDLGVMEHEKRWVIDDVEEVRATIRRIREKTESV
jgi:hypothetical protein